MRTVRREHHGVRREQRHPPARCGAVRQLLCAPARIHRQKVRRERLGRRVRVRVRVRVWGDAHGEGVRERGRHGRGRPRERRHHPTSRGRVSTGHATQRNALGADEDVREGHACELGACRGERCGRDGLWVRAGERAREHDLRGRAERGENQRHG